MVIVIAYPFLMSSAKAFVTIGRASSVSADFWLPFSSCSFSSALLSSSVSLSYGY